MRKGNPNIKDYGFKKGKSGNPNGRPKKLPELDQLMIEILGEVKDGKNAAQAILAALRAKAAKGDIRAAEVLLNRAYGMPKQTVENQGTQKIIVSIKKANAGASD